MDTTDARRWKHLAARPLGLVLLAVLVVFVAGWTIDESSLRRAPSSWGFTLVAVVFAAYSVPVLVVAGVCAFVTLALDGQREVATCAWIAASACAMAGLLLVVLTLDTLVGSPAGAAFGLVALPVAVSLSWPLVTCIRSHRSRS